METLFIVKKMLRFPILVEASGSKLDLFSIFGESKAKNVQYFLKVFGK